MSEIGKGASGLVGFPTPNNAADVEAYLLFLFPDPEWAQYVLGAAKTLTVPYNWYEAGDMLPEEASEAFRLIVEQAPYNLRDATVNAPFWDEESGDDTDDIEPRDDQEWYGQWDGETFIESLAYVFLTNFLSKLITTQGAIKYLAIPRTFRLLIKQNPHGAKLLLFLDGGLYAVVNGYSIVDQVLEVVVKAVAPSMGFRAEDVEPLELMIVHSGEHDPAATPDENGNYTVDVIRGRLSEQDVIPSNLRYNPDTDTVQFSPDGGATWNDAEGQDPRRAPAFLKPARTEPDARCDAAANMVAWVKAFLDEIIADLEGIGTAGLIVSTALNAWSLLFEPLAIVDLIANVAATVGGFGSTLLDSAFTSETYDLMLCIFFCDIASDGQVSEEQFEQIQTDMASLNATAQIVMALILGAQGRIGLSNAGAIGDAVGDCDDCACGWCYEWDGSNSPAWEFFPSAGYTGGARGEFASGQWLSTDHTSYTFSSEIMMRIALDMPATVRSIEIDYTRTIGSFTANPSQTDAMIIDSPNGWYDGAVLATQVSANDTAPTGAKWIWSGSQDVLTEITIWMFAAESITDGAYGSLTITRIKMRGDGDNPFGVDNC